MNKRRDPGPDANPLAPRMIMSVKGETLATGLPYRDGGCLLSRSPTAQTARRSI